ncbi:MAG: Ig-like domain-containing protein [Muribaculaceae bacterium]|nr:Ig-like domain-containing protein [Muribaculaceae bacterium]
MNLKKFGTLAAGLMIGFSALAASNYPAPDINTVIDRNYGGGLRQMSDNGKWAVGYGKSATQEENYSYPRLYNVETKEVTYLFTEQQANTISTMQALDVTDDGQIVVGQMNGKPAIWRASTGKWSVLSHKDPNYRYAGRVDRVTPDGHYAIGTVSNNDFMQCSMRVWDLSGETPVDITPDNLPIPYGTDGTLGDQGVKQIYASEIAPDGSSFTALVNFSFGAAHEWSFIYDMNKKEWTALGIDVEVQPDGKYKFTHKDNIYALETAHYVPGTRLLSGDAYLLDDSSCIYTYDIDSKQISFVPEGTYEYGGTDGNGVIYGSKAYSGPMRDWYFKVGNYWYDFSTVVTQLWDINWDEQYAHDGIGYTGTFVSTSNDGRTLLVTDYSTSPYQSYVIQLPAPLTEIADEVNLLGNYYVTPVSGASFANLREVKVTFDRDVDVVGDFNSVALYDANNQLIANSISMGVDPGNSKAVVATFRNRRLDDGKNYKVVIPEGIISIKGDKERTNKEISATYKGRPAAPVAPLSISPADGTTVTQINSTSNPIIIRFNCDIAAVEGNTSAMELYLIGENNSRERIATLSGSISGDELSVFPVLEQRLAKDSEYEVVIPAGVVADISGADPNEEIVLHYTGDYVPKINVVDGVIFEDDFDSGMTNKWMYYNGNPESEPTDEIQKWGFSNGYPWWTVMESYDAIGQSAASHSMFKSPAAADAWMVTSLLNIKDDSAYLAFKSQNYMADKDDVLKVYVYATDDVYTSLTSTIVDNIRYYGDLVYNEVQTPGASEALLVGDWKENTVKLDKYAGKNVYIAFVNDNRNKSAIFLDDVKVALDVKYALLNTTPVSVINKDEVEVSGVLQVMSETETFKGYDIKLLDSEDKVLSEIADPDVTAAKDWKLEFKMPNKLQIPVGKETHYKLSVTMGDVTEVNEFSIQNLARQTTKRVVIEEMTGQGCPNCPLGHAAIDWIEKDFPGLVLPIEIHTYTGDPWSNARVESLCRSLGMNAAPTAVINRTKNADGSYTIVSPMAIDGEKHIYKNAGVWYDHVVAELESMAPADIDITDITYDEATRRYTANIEVSYALDIENVNHNLLIEICEDGLEGIQDNNRAVYEDDALGEWGKGGIYGQSSVNYTYHNVARNWTGSTFNGTGGLIPVNVEAGKVYRAQMTLNVPNGVVPGNTHITAMLIDSQSGKVLNANRMKSSAGSSVESVEDATLAVAVKGNTVMVTCNGEVEVEVYTIDGMKVASAAGIDAVSCEAEGYHGIAIVMVKSAAGLKPYKVLFR